MSQLVDVVCLEGSLACVLLLSAADLFGAESALVTRLHMGLIQLWNQLSIQSFTVSLTPPSFRWEGMLNLCGVDTDGWLFLQQAGQGKAVFLACEGVWVPCTAGLVSCKSQGCTLLLHGVNENRNDEFVLMCFVTSAKHRWSVTLTL